MKTRNTVTEEHIDDIIKNTEFKYLMIFGKTTIVAAKLPNGFVIVESSSCVDPENYNGEIGKELARKKIYAKIRELEGYKLQDEIYSKSQSRDVRDHTIQELIDYGYEVRIETNIGSRARVSINDGRA